VRPVGTFFFWIIRFKLFRVRRVSFFFPSNNKNNNNLYIGTGSTTRTPLSAVLTPDAMKSYHKVFAFLWQLKRVEHSLVAHWKNHIHVAKSGAAVLLESSGVVHKCRALHHEMQHFVNNLHNYIMFEVLETSWEELSREMPVAKDLDGVIKAHEEYLQKVLSKVLVDKEAEEVRGLLNRVFDLIVRFSRSESRMYSTISEATLAIREKRKQIESKTRDGWGITPALESLSEQRREGLRRTFDLYTKEFQELHDEYTELIRNLLFILRDKYSRSENLQFLAFRLDFNTYYEDVAE